MTYREHRLRKAERLHGWAEKRGAKAATVHQERERYHGDIAFWTQPGDIPQRTRLFERMDRAHADTAKAKEMDSRAANIEAATDHAIYSDDPDATERLAERVAGLEAEREHIKAYNASCRKGAPDESLLDDKQRARLTATRRTSPYLLGKNGAFPAYALTNLGGDITRQKKRLATLSNPRPSLPRVILLRFAGKCTRCDRSLARGDSAHYDKGEKTVWCYPECAA